MADVVRRSTLPNGLRVVTCEMPHARSASVCAFIGVGSRYESDAMAGASHFLEHMAFKGTARRPLPQQISAAIEGDGGAINAGTEHELTVYWCKVARERLDTALDVLVDMLRNSLLEADAVERERLVVYEELAMMGDYPDYRADALIDELLWPGHPLGREIGGTRESVAGIGRDALADWMAERYSPPNVVVSVAGGVSHDAAVDALAGLCDGWGAGDAGGFVGFEGGQDAPQVRLEYQRSEQAHIRIGLPGLALGHPDRYALDLLSAALGEGMSSRLFVEVRENRGLAYDVHSEVGYFSDTGALLVAAGVDPKRVYDAAAVILDEVGSLRDGISDEELERAKRLLCGRLSLRMEDTRAVASRMGQGELLLGDPGDLDEVMAGVRAVSGDDVRRVAGDVVVGDRLNMSVAGPCRGLRRLERLLVFR